MKPHIALYPGTFDPLTNGHTHLIKRASRLFDHVIVAIAENTKKIPLLTLAQRKSLAEAILAGLTNVEVCCFKGLTVDLAKAKNATILVRGVRMSADLDHEIRLNDMNQALYPELETVFLIPTPPYAHISSSLVREVASMGGDISSFVDDRVLQLLKN